VFTFHIIGDVPSKASNDSAKTVFFILSFLFLFFLFSDC